MDIFQTASTSQSDRVDVVAIKHSEALAAKGEQV
jgi:hypothetical protein